MGSVIRFERNMPVDNGRPAAETDRGYIKLHRKLQDQAFSRCPVKLAVWNYLLLNASHKPYRTTLGSQSITLLPGQLISGRNKILRDAFDQKLIKVTADMVRGALDLFRREDMISAAPSRAGTVYTIVNWERYQIGFIPQPIPNPQNQPVTQPSPQAEASKHALPGDTRPNQNTNPIPKGEASPVPTIQEDNTLLPKGNGQNSGEFGQDSGELDLEPPTPKAKSKVPPCPYQEIQQAYNECLPTMTGSRVLADKTKAQIQRQWRKCKSHQSVDFWRQYFADLNQLTERIEFWSGGGAGNGKKRGIDLVTREDIFVRSVNELIDQGVWQ